MGSSMGLMDSTRLPGVGVGCLIDARLGVEGVSAGLVSWHMALSTKQ